jgi:hypothetical protein
MVVLYHIFHTSFFGGTSIARFHGIQRLRQRLALANQLVKAFQNYQRSRCILACDDERSSCARVRIVATITILQGLSFLPSQFLRKSPSLQTLELCGIDFAEEHCRALQHSSTIETKLVTPLYGRQRIFYQWFPAQ